MASKSWHTVKVRLCEHAGCEVALEAEVIYSSEILPDQPPRLLAHRCSRGLECSLNEHPACVWAGSNPAYDPFLD